jgi:hypothetical protein
MPRIYTSTSDPVDFCKACFPDALLAQARYAHVGDGPDGRGNCYEWNADHPAYEDTDYTCESCGKPLRIRDN